MHDSFYKDSYDKVIETDKDEIFSQRDERYKNLQELIGMLGMAEYCAVHPEFLWQSVLNYFKDMNDLKKRHGLTFIEIEKVYAYEVYWYLRNNVIQVTDVEKQMNDPKNLEFPHRLFANEYILATWVMKSLCTGLKRSTVFANYIDKIDGQFEHKFENHLSVLEFRKKLYYTFRYRTYTKKGILLAFEGFKAGMEFVYGNLLVQG
jgi:hypothetical protein